MINGSENYKTATAFRQAVQALLKAEAKKRGRPLEEVKREFLFQRFLALLFSNSDGQWVLKGGAGLLMRLVEARSSRDLDLLHLEELNPDDAIAELKEQTAPQDSDHLTFVIGDKVTYSRNNPVVEIAVVAYIGAEFGHFSIDLATEKHLLAVPELVRPAPVVEVPGLGELPELVLYPLTDQVADKVCAMYEVHGETRSPSNRFRDLVDLVIIVTGSDLEAEPVARALQSESKRRGLELPTTMASPADTWDKGYSAYAKTTKIDSALHQLEAALEHVGACLNPVLDGTVTTGSWRPGTGWTP